jgi:hypothetical protein
MIHCLHPFFLTLSLTILPGDLLVVQLPLSSRILEQTQDSPYNHAAIILRAGADISVSDAYGARGVSETSLCQWLEKRQPQELLLRRHREVISSQRLEEAYLYFKGLPFDPVFLWDNRDERGEKMYCSEFVAKLLNHVTEEKILPAPMDYSRAFPYWTKYFATYDMDVPQHLPGVSPQALAISDFFETLTLLQL